MAAAPAAGRWLFGLHALCWVHAERLVHKLDAFTGLHRTSQDHVRGLTWWSCSDLKAYRADPTPWRRTELRARFRRIFHRQAGFATLGRLLGRLHASKPPLLMVFDRPEATLHANGSENDIHCQVTKRKASDGTCSDMGRDCRDVFPSLAKNCAKLRIAFKDYLGSRLAVPGCPKIRTCQVSPACGAGHHDRLGFCLSYFGGMGSMFGAALQTGRATIGDLRWTVEVMAASRQQLEDDGGR